MESLPLVTTVVVGTLLLSAFVKIATALSIFRVGLGLDGAAFGLVVLLLSIALTLPTTDMPAVMVGLGGFDGPPAPGSPRAAPGLANLERQYRDRLERSVDPVIAQKISQAQSAFRARAANASLANESAAATGSGLSSGNQTKSDVSGQSPDGPAPSVGVPVTFEALVAAYLLTQLQVAFRLGLLFIIPFIVIDVLVANVVAALGITSMPQRVIALPLKLVLFLAVDGWSLIGTKLIGG